MKLLRNFVPYHHRHCHLEELLEVRTFQGSSEFASAKSPFPRLDSSQQGVDSVRGRRDARSSGRGELRHLPKVLVTRRGQKHLCEKTLFQITEFLGEERHDLGGVWG